MTNKKQLIVNMMLVFEKKGKKNKTDNNKCTKKNQEIDYMNNNIV
jgi:hypothetical protein